MTTYSIYLPVEYTPVPVVYTLSYDNVSHMTGIYQVYDICHTPVIYLVYIIMILVPGPDIPYHFFRSIMILVIGNIPGIYLSIEIVRGCAAARQQNCD